MNETNVEQDSLELARSAVDYVLKRIRDDENIRYHMGAFTESYERLKAAHSVLNGFSPEAVDEEIFSRKLTRKPYAEIVRDARSLLDRYESCETDSKTTLARLRSVLQ